MSKIKSISRTGWLVAGIIAALLLVPTTAVAVTTATMTIIKGGTAAGQASVTPAHQLLATTISPKSYVNTEFFEVSGAAEAFVPIVSPPSGDALVVTTIHLDTLNNPTPGIDEGFEFFISTGTACSGNRVGSYEATVNPGSVGETDIPYTPGLAVPAGDGLCALGFGSTIEGYVSVTGYTVPSSDVPAAPLHRLPALPRQHR